MRARFQRYGSAHRYMKFLAAGGFNYKLTNIIDKKTDETKGYQVEVASTSGHKKGIPADEYSYTVPYRFDPPKPLTAEEAAAYRARWEALQ